ncbi:MAG TPA: flagellar motor protein MotB [Humidesulfovibrio sp.]|uniref:OmpA/MotB family protein n=1 Tax=Humidesulfovibrio sp. TaxID=2910988 RepID=UPI002C90EC0C|nr:flagellar motor protein MotB [Humidesulfovibrio sp.]HWR03251.1 flagellar motor protein MotB [Humidesulfovibrio sp.]
MARKKFHGGSWKVAYADFVTAMMAFFLLMWILNIVPPETKQVLSTYFQPASDTSGPGGPVMILDVNANTADRAVRGIPKPDDAQSRSQRFEIASKFKRIILDNPELMSQSGLSSDETGVLLRINNSAMFAPGSAQLTPQARRVLDEALGVLKEYNMDLLVRGHAAQQEHTGGAFASPWELSGARAAAAAGYVSASGAIISTRVRAISYGATRPLRPETTQENKVTNGRVELYFHRPDALNFGSGL